MEQNSHPHSQPSLSDLELPWSDTCERNQHPVLQTMEGWLLQHSPANAAGRTSAMKPEVPWATGERMEGSG